MASFESFQSSSSRNPWADEAHTLGSIRNILYLAEKTGHLSQRSLFDQEEVLAKASEKYSSLRAIAALQDIENKRKKIDETNLEIQRRLLDIETKDLTHIDVFEKRIGRLQHINNHLQAIVSNKEDLLHRLQQPIVGDVIKIEASYQKYACELIPQLVPVLSELNNHLDNMEWLGKANFSEGDMFNLLGEVSTLLAELQSWFHSLCQMRDLLHQILEQRTSSILPHSVSRGHDESHKS